MENKKNQTALITGASSGIGYELAKIFAKEKYNVVLVSRSEEELQVIAKNFQNEYGVQATVIATDLFDPSAAEELYNTVKQKGLQIDVLVNDAGQGTYGKFNEIELQSELDIIQLNISSLVVLTKLFLKDMLARGEGKILQLASMVSKIPSPYMAVYAGTKAFVFNFTQSLVSELKGTGITVTALQPGATDTDFFHKAGAEDIKVVQDDDLGDPATVAKDGYDALMNGENHVVSGAKNKMMATMANVTPEQTLAEQMKDMNKEVK